MGVWHLPIRSAECRHQFSLEQARGTNRAAAAGEPNARLARRIVSARIGSDRISSHRIGTSAHIYTHTVILRMTAMEEISSSFYLRLRYLPTLVSWPYKRLLLPAFERRPARPLCARHSISQRDVGWLWLWLGPPQVAGHSSARARAARSANKRWCRNSAQPNQRR